MADAVVAPTVFLSYSHSEQETARELCAALTSNGVFVLVDDEKHLKPGDDIADFARRMIKRADATVCLVSSTSLSSAWVVFEAATALQKEYDDPSARLVACATDRAFFEVGFQLGITSRIDDEIRLLKEQILKHIEADLDIAVLEAQRTRFRAMRESLGAVLARLQNSLTLILETDGVAACARRIADHVRDLNGQRPSRTDPRDIRARAQALRKFLAAEQTESALGQLLQFVEEFSNDRDRVNSAISCCNTLRRIARLEEQKRLPFLDAESRREPTIVKVLELIDQIEVDPQLPIG